MSDQCYDFSNSNLAVPVFAQSALRIIFDGVLGNLQGTEPICYKPSTTQLLETGAFKSRQNQLRRALTDLIEKRGRPAPHK